MTQLTPHFTLAELIRSDTADRLGDDNRPTAAHAKNLQALAEALERVRDLVGGPIRVTSGYRNPRVNAAVGGVANSDHAQGLAADIQRPGMHPRDLARAIAASDIAFDQVIYEASRSVVHFGLGKRMRRQVLTQAKGPGTPVTVGVADV